MADIPDQDNNSNRTLDQLFQNNRDWAASMVAQDATFFQKLASQQSPEYLWIGCSDSRVPANEIVNLLPGELFVHRNIANVVVHTDLNCLSVLQFAIDVLGVKHVIVCGHYGCGGVAAAMGNQHFGLIDNWIRHIKDVYRLHTKELDSIGDEGARFRRFVELNVEEQVYDLAKTSILQAAWERGQQVHIHGWVYDIRDGLIVDLNKTIKNNHSLDEVYQLNI